MYVYGGNSDEESLGDLWCFDILGKKWTNMQTTGDIPKEIEGHSACCFNDNYMFIYGGWNGKEMNSDYFLLDVQKQIWHKVKHGSGEEPSPRES